jgi:hypothetical protein
MGSRNGSTVDNIRPLWGVAEVLFYCVYMIHPAASGGKALDSVIRRVGTLLQCEIRVMIVEPAILEPNDDYRHG